MTCEVGDSAMHCKGPAVSGGAAQYCVGRPALACLLAWHCAGGPPQSPPWPVCWPATVERRQTWPQLRCLQTEHTQGTWPQPDSGGFSELLISAWPSPHLPRLPSPTSRQLTHLPRPPRITFGSEEFQYQLYSECLNLIMICSDINDSYFFVK